MSHYLDTLKAGFVNELEKIAFSVTRTEAVTREKIASAREEAEIDAKLGPAWGAFVDAKTPAHKIREALSTLGGGVAGAGLGAGVGALGAMGLRGLGVPVTPGGGARAGGLIGGGLGLGVGGVLGDSHGQSDVDLGRKYERYANLEDKVLGTGAGSARATLHASQAGSAKK